MEKVYILLAIGFVLLCISLLVGIVGIFHYIIKLSSKKFEIASQSQSQKLNHKE